jgi:hypothetical protein
MSNIPTVFKPKEAFSFLLSRIKEYNPNSRKTGILPHLKSFLADTTIQDLLCEGKDPALPANTSPIAPDDDIRSTLQSLSKAISSIQRQLSTTPKPKAATPDKGNKANGKKTPPKTYAAIAGARPPNPSLVVDSAKFFEAEKNRLAPGELCGLINERLRSLSQTPVIVAAVRWTSKGNLVVTGGPNTTPHSLQTVSAYISDYMSELARLPTHEYFEIARPNVKWSKISINGVPTGASDQHEVYSHAENHDSLEANNPSYASLTITQPPSWVRPPASYTTGSVSSLSLAFEDPDGSKLRALLMERYLYVHGQRATIRKWKQRQPQHKDKASKNTVTHTNDDESSHSSSDEEDIAIQLHPLPNTEDPLPASDSPIGLIPTATSNTARKSHEATARPPNPPRNAKDKNKSRAK